MRQFTVIALTVAFALCPPVYAQVQQAQCAPGDANCVPLAPNGQELERVISFDIFDTILGRRVPEPPDVFSLLDQQGYVGFRAARQKAEALSTTKEWEDIYDWFQKITGVDREMRLRLQELEVQAEESVVYRIHENAKLLTESSVIISDMYLTKPLILRLLRRIGVPFNESRVYVSPYGKGVGYMWDIVKAKYNISLHRGDNAHSDVHMARQYGVPAQHSTVHMFIESEGVFLQHNAVNAACALRQYRLSRATPTSQLALAQLEVNIAAMLHMTTVIAHYVQAEGLQRVVLTTPDGCLLEKLLHALYPSLDVVRLRASELVFTLQGDSTEFRDYLRSVYIPGKTLLFTLHSLPAIAVYVLARTFGVYPRVHTYMPFNEDGPSPPDATESFRTRSLGFPFLLTLHPDLAGNVTYVHRGGADVRLPLPLAALETAKEVHAVVDGFAKFAATMRSAFVSPELPPYDAPLWMRIAEMTGNLGYNLRGLAPTPQLPLRHAFTETGSDKLAGYAHLFERVLMPFTVLPRVAVLEVGLNEQASSLQLWEQYFGGRATVYGFDNRAETAATVRGRYTVFVGDQANPADLAQVQAAAPFNIIVDDGWHAAMHQQVSLVNLWQYVAPGGVYIVEDLHLQPATETLSESTKRLLSLWSMGIPSVTPWVSLPQANAILQEVESIEVFEPSSEAGCLAVLHKKRPY